MILFFIKSQKHQYADEDYAIGVAGYKRPGEIMVMDRNELWIELDR